MPDGRSHARATIALAAVTALTVSQVDAVTVSFTAQGWINSATLQPSQWITAGVAVGVLVTPDLDLDAGFYSNYLLRRLPVVGDVLERVWSLYWRPYAKVAKHRSIMSHSFAVSTAIRAAWLAPAFLWLSSGILWQVLLGMMLADALHIALDLLTEFRDGWRLLRK